MSEPSTANTVPNMAQRSLPVEDAESADAESQADETAEDIFGGEANAQATANLVVQYVDSWEQRKRRMSAEEFLREQFARSPDLWANQEEAATAAREVTEAVERLNAERASLRSHLTSGKSKASWMADAIERGAAASGTANVAAYAAGLDEALAKSNADMLRTVQTQSGAFNRLPNLDGLIAEQHHANTFNLDAAAKGSEYRARVLGSFGENSMDVGVYDGQGRLVQRYQSKYGKDAEATSALFSHGDYRGQRKLVPAGQQDRIDGATDVIEVGGVRSKPLSKEEAKAAQEAAREGKNAEYDWNDISRIDVGKRIGKEALASAAISCGFQGVHILGRRVWNFLTGERNRPGSEDLAEFFETSIETAANAGVQTTVTGATVEAARRGYIPVLRTTPAGHIAAIVHTGMENAKVLYKWATGEMTAAEALDTMGSNTCSAIGGLKGAGAGAAQGVAWGTVLGPVGAAVGGFVGGLVGYIAGSKIGEAVYEGAKTIVKTAVKVVATVVEGAWEVVKAVGRALNPFNWF